MKSQTIAALVILGLLALVLIANAGKSCPLSFYFAKFDANCALTFLGFTASGVLVGALISK